MSKQKQDQPKGKQKVTPAKKDATKEMPVVPPVEAPDAKPKGKGKKATTETPASKPKRATKE